jgi:hypothetical protein
MTTNPLLALLGPQFCRINDGPLLPLRAVLRMVGAQLEDDAARERSSVDRSAGAAPTLTATLDAPGDYWTHTAGWFGVGADFNAAGLIYLTASDVGARIAGFRVPSGSAAAYRKLLINSGTHTLQLVNFRLGSGEDSGPDGNDPGMLQCTARTLTPGESARLVWDPIAQHWLVNAGQYSGDFVTHENDIVTDDGNTITEGV